MVRDVSVILRVTLNCKRSYGALGETELAGCYYGQFGDIWKEAGPDLQHYADVARSWLEGLRG